MYASGVYDVAFFFFFSEREQLKADRQDPLEAMM